LARFLARYDAKCVSCVIAAAAVALIAGRSAERVVNSGEAPTRTETPASTSAPSTPPSNAHLVDAFDYVAHVNDAAG
jgi:hypothetical protein